MIAKQLKIIIVCIIAVALLVASYFIVNKIVKDKSETDEEEKIELLDGEAEGGSTKPRIIEELSEEDIASVVLHNENGDISFERDSKSGDTTVVGCENYPISTDMIDSLYSRLSSILVTRIEIEPSDLSKYGLDEQSNPNYVLIKKTDGTEYKLKFGLLTPDTTSYYVMCDGRNVVYSVNNSNIEDVLFVPAEAYISPLVAPTLEDVSYVDIEKISIKHNGKDFIAFEKVPENYKEETGYTITHKMTYPTNYLVNITNFEKLLGSFAELYGTEVVGFGYEHNDDFSELEKFGFKDGITEIEYSYEGVPTILYVGGKTDDGTGYYVYSLYYDTLTIVSADSLPFIEWKLGDYIGENLFQMSINYIDKIEISAGNTSAEFVLSDNSDALKVLCNGKYLDTDSDGNCANFRQFYKCILRVRWDGYTDIPETLNNPMLTMKITTKFGEVFDYKFYQISNLRCYFTYNGYGEFYTEKESLDEFIDNFNRVIRNEEIDIEF